MPAENAQEIGEFLDYFWERENGRVCLAEMFQGEAGSFKRHLGTWPEQRDDLIKFVSAKSALGFDIFFAPAMFKADANSTEIADVQSVNTRWVDFDGGAPENWETYSKERHVPEPTLIVQSSVSDRQHVYWRTSRTEDIDNAQDVNRALAATFGADKSGWDANQLLRIPGTHNFGFASRGSRKPWYADTPVPVRLISGSRSRVIEEGDFTTLRSAERQVLERIAIADVPDISEVLALGTWTRDLYDQFRLTEKEASESSPEKRSGALMKLAYLSAESGLTDEQMYAVIADTGKRWNKYNDRSNAGRDKLIRDLIARARAKVGYGRMEDLTFAGLTESVAQDVALSTKIVYNYQEFMESDFTVNWLIDDLLAVGGFGVIVGQPNVGKTTMGMIMAHDVAVGAERIGVWKNTTGAKKVLFLSLEMGGNELHLFMENMAPKYQGDVTPLSKNLHIVPLGSPLYLDRPEGQNFLNNLISEYRPDILFIDSLQKVTSKPMGDEIATKMLLDYIRVVRTKYDTAVFMVHHERKRSSDRSGGMAGELSDMYGSQLIAAEIDFAIALRESGTYVAMDMYKNRLAPKIETTMFKRTAHMQFEAVDHLEGVRDYGQAERSPQETNPGFSGNGLVSFGLG